MLYNNAFQTKNMLYKYISKRHKIKNSIVHRFSHFLNFPYICMSFFYVFQGVIQFSGNSLHVTQVSYKRKFKKYETFNIIVTFNL